MTAVDDILSQVPLQQLAAQLGVEPAQAEQAARQALPALLHGMGANATDPSGLASLEKAVGQHSPSLLDGGVDLNEVDANDGAKIVNHVFGNNSGQVVNQLGGVGGGSGLVAKLLPLLAPLVMSYLAKQLQSSGGGRAAGGAGGAGLGPLGEILGSLLGGAATGSHQAGGGSKGNVGGVDIGDLLGGLLGGGRR